MDIDPTTTAADVFEKHGNQAMQFAAMRANNHALEHDTPGFRHWAQVVTELNTMSLLQTKPNRLTVRAKKPRKSKAK